MDRIDFEFLVMRQLPNGQWKLARRLPANTGEVDVAACAAKMARTYKTRVSVLGADPCAVMHAHTYDQDGVRVY